MNPEIARSVDAAGLRTNYHDLGQGAPVLLIHGSGPGVSAWANWRLVMPELARRARVIAPDMVGFGYTERPPGFDPATNPVPGGIFIAGGDANLGPEKAENWSVGVDFTPEVFSGFRASFTYYNLLFKDRISTPSRTFYTDPNFRRFIVDNFQCDAGATYDPANPKVGNCRPIPIPAAQVWDLIKDISRVSFPTAVNGPADLPPIYNVTLLRRANLSYIKTDGIDFDLSYRWNWDGIDMTAQVSVLLKQAKGVLMVPAVALGPKRRGDERMVRVLDEKGQPQPRKVTVGINNGASAEILSGLKEGERVVVGEAGAAGASTGGNRGGMQMRVGGPGMGRR